MVRSVHTKIAHERTAFGYAAVTALIIGIGSVLATGIDIIWLLGDMSNGAHTYHYYVLVGLCTAFVIMIISFSWLYGAINLYLKRVDSRRQKHYEAQHRNYTAPMHSNISKKKVSQS